MQNKCSLKRRSCRGAVLKPRTSFFSFFAVASRKVERFRLLEPFEGSELCSPMASQSRESCALSVVYGVL